jgi:hypothetical protein
MFKRDGLSFQYPENWTVSPEPYGGGWSVTVQSPATAFLTLTLDERVPGMGELADVALEALRSEYKELDAEPVGATLAGRPAVGYDVEFFSLDLTNTCLIRSFATAAGTVLAVAEATDLEETNLAVLRAMLASIRVADD